jgi:hypothetical protein
MSGHFNAAWQQVTCSSCGRTYRCTPADDYYGNTTATDGVCEKCLIGNLPLLDHEVTREAMSSNDIEMRLTLRTDGRIEIWLNEGRPATEVAEMLRKIADGFESNPKRVG